MRNHKLKEKEKDEKDLEFVPSLKPENEDITSFKKRPEKKHNPNATLGDILRQPGEPDPKEPPPEAKSILLPLVFLSVGWLVIMGIVGGVLFSKISTLESQLSKTPLSSEASIVKNDNGSKSLVSAGSSEDIKALEQQLSGLQKLVEKRNKTSIANNTRSIKELKNMTRESRDAVKSLVVEVEELKDLQKDALVSGNSNSNDGGVSRAALKKLEKKQKALEKSLALELKALKRLESRVKRLGENSSAPAPLASSAPSGDQLSGLKSSLAGLEKQIGANDNAIKSIEAENDQLKRSISLLRAESARVYRLVESSMKN